MTTDRTFADHYDGYYGQSPEYRSPSRASAAREKFANVAKLWAAGTAPEDGEHLATYVPRPPSVVDIGCGDGAVASCMADAGFYRSLAGYDVSSSGIRTAQARNLPNAEFAVTPDGSIPVADKHFDLAVLSHVVEHVENPRQVLREAERVAKWVIVEVPLEHTIRHGGDFQWTSNGHVNFYDLTLIRKLMQSCNLIVTRELVTTPGLDWLRATGDRVGVMKWGIRRTAIALAPPLARMSLTYHATLLATTRLPEWR